PATVTADWAADLESMSRLVVETFDNMALLDPVYSLTFCSIPPCSAPGPHILATQHI
ncbi:hypothetical protein Tco_1496886, partial [Tanacetum coccineum]